MQYFAYLMLGAGLVAWSPLASAIVGRHDVPDEQYLSFAEDVPPVINLDLLGTDKAADGMGTLIAPRWILTAAHLEEALAPGIHVQIGATTVQVTDVFVYPDWTEEHIDIALIRLDEEVSGIAPVPIDRGSLEEGESVVFAGHGDYGDGIRGPIGNDRELRAARNRLDEIDRHFLKFRFDAPDDVNALPLEGISGPGDSGGPAFVKRQSGWYVVGVSSAQSTKATGGKEGRYGVTEYYIWVPKFAAWIDETLASFGDEATGAGWTPSADR